MKPAAEIIVRAITDSEFAKQLKEEAEAASKGGVESDAHRKLLSHFATSPEELEDLMANRGPMMFGITTTTTTTTYTTAACTTTGTTTTTTTN